MVGHTTTTDTETNGPARAEFAGLSVPLENKPETVKQTTHVQDVTEWRIYFRRNGAPPMPPSADPVQVAPTVVAPPQSAPAPITPPPA